MDLWHKMREFFLSLSEKLKTHGKTSGGGSRGGDRSSDGNGLLKLWQDVQTCGYEDVHVMWKLLQKPQQENIETPKSEGEMVVAAKCRPSSSWRALLWLKHRTRCLVSRKRKSIISGKGTAKGRIQENKSY